MDSLKKSAVWRYAHCIPHAIIPGELRDFLLDPGSTTRRMQHEYAAQTKVEVLSQQWRYPHYQEARRLNLHLSQHALIREVHLSCQDHIWMYARTVFPGYFFTGKNQRLQYELDQRPLGELLFLDPTVQRSSFELTLLHSDSLEFEWATRHLGEKLASAHLWARRSIIQLQKKPLLLTEIFFPAFLELKKVKERVPNDCPN